MVTTLTVLLLTGCGLFSSSKARKQGESQARADIAAGRPTLRTTDHLVWHYAPVDAATGLPTTNWALHCGTGVDLDAYQARIDGYNAVIRAALFRGELEAHRLDAKLLDRPAVERLFAAGDPVELSIAEGAAPPAGSPYRIEFRPVAGRADRQPFPARPCSSMRARPSSCAAKTGLC
jgi:hypothetical protein